MFMYLMLLYSELWNGLTKWIHYWFSTLNSSYGWSAESWMFLVNDIMVCLWRSHGHQRNQKTAPNCYDTDIAADLGNGYSLFLWQSIVEVYDHLDHWFHALTAHRIWEQRRKCSGEKKKEASKLFFYFYYSYYFKFKLLPATVSPRQSRLVH